MTPKDLGPVPCPNPACDKDVDPTATPGPGRRRKYCSDACGRAYRKIRITQRTPDTKAHDEDARQITDDMISRITSLREHVRDGNALAGLQQIVEIANDLDDLRAAVVQQARDRGNKAPAIAGALHITIDKLGRDLSTDSITRRMHHRHAHNTPPPPCGPAAPLPASAVRAPGQRRAYPAGETKARSKLGPEGGGPPGRDPVTALASALSHLQRASKKTLKSLGDEARVSASYISRILSGERCPSWKVTHRMVHACGGDLDVVRPLWDAANGRRTARAGSLHTALRGLHLSAACPDPTQICLDSNYALTEREVIALLQGSLVPDWATVGRIVDVLHGQLEDIRPLWDHAHLSRLTDPTRCVPERLTPLAEAFG